jgi:hypothetical protein
MSYWIAGMLTAADVPVLSGTGTCSVPVGTVGREQFENPGGSCAAGRCHGCRGLGCAA